MNVGDVRNRVFISYAHEDIELAEDFRKHLAVRLRAEAPVWIDTEIRAGERWENALNDALHASSCALLLLSVDFLNSDYVGTKELPGMLQEARRGLRVVPVVVRECAWDAIPDLQCLQHARPPSPCLASLREHSPSEYESAIEAVCKIVAGYVGQLGRQSRAETLSRVPDVLSKIDGLSISGAKRGGDYTVVYRGEMQGRDVAVKVMFGMTLGELRDAFKAALAVAKKVEHHCFVPILHERVEDDDAPPIVVSPWIDSTQLLHRVAQEPLPIDRVAMFLRRASDALAMLHEQNGIYGVLTPDNVWVEERLKILRFPAVSIYGFLSIQQPWHKATHSFLAGLAWHNPGGVVSHAPHDLRRRALEVHVRECRPRVPRIDFQKHAQHLCAGAVQRHVDARLLRQEHERHDRIRHIVHLPLAPDVRRKIGKRLIEVVLHRFVEGLAAHAVILLDRGRHRRVLDAVTRHTRARVPRPWLRRGHPCRERRIPDRTRRAGHRAPLVP